MLVGKGLRKAGCINCIAMENPNDPCFIIMYPNLALFYQLKGRTTI